MRKHDEEEFRAYARQYAPLMQRSAYLLCGDWHAADDLVQNALFKLYKAWPRINRKHTPTNYARKVLVHCWLDERRRPWRRHENSKADVPEVEQLDADPAVTQEQQQTRDELVDALATVPPKQRAVLMLRYFEQLSVAETAEALACSEGTVRSQASRGMAALRDAYQRKHAVIQEEIRCTSTN